MRDEQITKALECCGRENCCGCPYRDNCHQGNPMIRDALALIERQRNEIAQARAEAFREFAEQLKSHIIETNIIYLIDEITQQITEEQK